MNKTLLILLAVSLLAPLYAEEQQGILYSPVGKRDPFKPPVTDSPVREPSTAQNSLSEYTIDQLKLRAILRRRGQTTALFEDPSGFTHILRTGDSIGRDKGTISRILNTDVIVTERTVNYLGTESLYERVISLPED